MFHVLYTTPMEAALFKAGSASTAEGALKLARQTQATREFDVHDQHVYLLTPEGDLIEYTIEELT